MIRQDIVNFIRNQTSNGYELRDIKKHLVKYGYPDKDVDDSARYVFQSRYVDRELVKYISENLGRGYSASLIRDHLRKNGYRDHEINNAFNLAHKAEPREIKHVVHLSKTTMGAVFAIIFLIIGAGFLFYSLANREPATKLLDVEAEILAASGGSVDINIELTNMGSANRYDVTIKYDLIDAQTGEAVQAKTETMAIETRLSKKLTMDNIPAGNYLVKVAADYGGEEAYAETSAFSMEGQQAQTGQEETAGVNAMARSELLDYVKKIAETDKVKAVETCGLVEKEAYRQACYTELAIFLKNSYLCEKTEKQESKDNCYISYAKAAADYSVCGSISNNFLKQTCVTMGR